MVTEGNYLLLPDGAWERYAPLLDEVWHVELDDDVRRERLVRRHEQFGKSPDAARAWVERVDEPNARLISATRESADIVVRIDELSNCTFLISAIQRATHLMSGQAVV